MDDDFEDDDEMQHEVDFAGFDKAECFGGPVDGSFLPVPVFGDMQAEPGTIISGYNHMTGDMMHYRLEEREDVGETKFIFRFMAEEHAPGISYDEFMRRSEAFQSGDDND